jgi:signal transduction histidine kinase
VAQPASQAGRLAWYERIVQVVASVSEQSSGSPDPFEPLSVLVGELTRLLGNHATAVYRYEPEGRVLRLVCGHVGGRTSAELPGHPYGRADLPAPVDDFPAWPELVASGRPQFLAMPLESTTPPSNEWHVQHRHRYLIQSALMVQGEPLGLLGLAFQTEFAPDAAQLEAYSVLAQHLTLVLQQAELALKIQQVAALERAQAVLLEREQAARQRSDELEQTNVALKVRGGLLSVLAEATRKILEAPDLISGIHGLLRRLGESTQLSRVLFFLERASASGGKEHYVVTEWCAPGITDHRSVGIEVIPNSVAKPFLDRMQGRDAFRLDMQQAEEPMRSALASLKILSTGCAPVKIEGEYVGVIAFDDCATARSDEAAHVDAFLAAADVIGAALQRERSAEARAVELERSSEALQRTIDAVSELETLNQFLPRALRIVAEAFGAKSASYYEHPESTIYLRYWLLDGQLYGPKELPKLDERQYAVMVRLAQGFTVPPEHLGVDLHNRVRPSIIHHATATASPALHDFAMRMGWEWELNVPLVIGGRAEGAIVMYRCSGSPFTEADFALAEGLAKQMALAMKISGLAQGEREAASAQAVALERLRIAAEMHDSLAQSFTSIALQSESLRSRTQGSSAAADTLQVIEQTARQGLAEVRASVLTLHSLDGPPGTLDKALGQLAARCNVPGSIQCDFVSKGEPCDLSGDSRESLMRIAREALNNAMRHSGGTRMQLTVTYVGGRVRLTVEDDGKGLTDDVSRGRRGFGLEGMSRRAGMIGGSLRLLQSELGGAMVAVDLPCLSSQAIRKDPWE